MKRICLVFTLILFYAGLRIPVEAADHANAIRYICAGMDKSYAVLSDGSLYTWGEGRAYTTLAYQEGEPVKSKPEKTDSGIMAAGDTSTMHTSWTIRTDGSFWYGSEKLMERAVSCDGEYVLLTDGSLWYLSLGNVSKVIDDVKKYSHWGTSLAVIKTDGSVWLRGDEVVNQYGSMALPDEFYKLVDGAVDIAQGQANLFIVKSDGSLWGWGNNSYGQLGQGNKKDLPDYTAYHILDDVRSVVCDGAAVFAIKNDDSLWGWGDGSHGKLGIGADGLKYSNALAMYCGSITQPVKVMDDVADVSMNSHSLILKTDGSLWACGDNSAFAVGDNARLRLTAWGDYSCDRLEPVKIFSGNGMENTAEASVFSDVKTDSYYFEPVFWAVENNITNGTGKNTFSPDQTCSCAEIITFLWRSAGSPVPDNTDSNATDFYYTDAVLWAEENGIIYSGNFWPDESCTRKMAVEYMWKYAGCPDAADAAFMDVDSRAVDWAVAYGITNGTGNMLFSPDDICTRAQIITFLYRGFAVEIFR